MDPLFATPEDREEFIARHSLDVIPKASLDEAEGRCWLGIDAGSTTIKAVVIDSQDRIVFTHYASNEGDPVAAAVDIVRAVRSALPEGCEIGRSCATGYGEGLVKAALTMDEGEMTIQPNAYQVASDGTNNGIAFFNDSVRDGLKGSVFSDTDTGFVSGKADQESLIAHNVLGCQYDENATTTCWNGNAQDHYADAGQVVNYAEIHDNMTLYDKLRKSVSTDDDATTVARAKLADSVVYLSEGIPAIQLGQEFLRTKGGDGNSYNTGDAVNAIDWDRTTQYADSVDYVKGLIKLRKQINALRLTDYNDINANVTMLKSADGVVAYQAEQSDGTYVVIFNANADKTAIEGLANGSYQVLAADGKVYSDDAIANVDLAEGASYEAGALSATVLKLDSSTKPDTDSAPVIKGLVASDSVTLGSKFDPMSGVSAWDEVDGDLTDKITVEGSVDTSKEGEYTLVYSVTNAGARPPPSRAR